MSLDATLLAELIIGAILGGRLPPGTRLDGQGLDLPPGLLNNALAEICACGLAERHPDLGVRVATPDLTLLLDRFEAVGEIAALCAGLAARRARVTDLHALEWPIGGDRRQWSMHEHRALVDAICDRNEAQAAVIMRGHLRAIMREVLFIAGICPTDPV